MENIQDLMVLLAYGLGLAFLAVLVLFAIVLLGKLSKWLDLKLGTVDQQLVPLGQTFVGRAINQGLVEFRSRVDEVDDPLIQAGMRLKPLRELQKAGLISPEQFVEFASKALNEAIKLTDGIPNYQLEVKPPSE